MTGRKLRRDPRPPRMLRRESDGSLYDTDEHRRVSVAELGDDVRAGRRFRAHHHESGDDCTRSVLLEVLRSSAPAGQGIDRFIGATQLPALTSALAAIAARAAEERIGRDGGLRRANGRRRSAAPADSPAELLGDGDGEGR